MKHCKRRPAFTLVELLVVIAIIGVLIALLLPAVQAARESARRVQCTNQVKQMILAMHNHVSSLRSFPTGGIEPWPKIEDYSSGGKPFTGRKQGLSWAFQILPYLEEDAVHGLATTAQISGSPVNAYFCPSRRGPIQREGRWLMDYGALVPIAPRSAYNPLAARNLYTVGTDGFVSACRDGELWRHPTSSAGYRPGPLTGSQRQDPRYKYYGVIVRSGLYRDVNKSEEWNTNFSPPVTFAKIPDGTSKTTVITEKWLNTSYYTDGWPPADDAGWSDGWDFDAMRLACCAPRPDSNDPGSLKYQLVTGSAHTAGVNTGFADGSVRFLNFEIEPEIFNSLANREDGEIIDKESF